MKHFYKYHGSGNDFIIIDNRSCAISDDIETIKSLCRLHTGIGADGLILIENSVKAHYTMRYFNRDGRTVDFCGNALRCTAACIRRFLGGKEQFTIASNIAIHRAEAFSDGLCKVDLGEFSGEIQPKKMAIDRQNYVIYSLKIGVPHLVIFVDRFENLAVSELGKRLRFHSDYQPEGTNVNFVITQKHALLIRTYERGVEAETLACGSGGAAACLCSMLLEKTVLKERQIPVTFAGGEQVSYELRKNRKALWEISLMGQAHYVFQGQTEIGNHCPENLQKNASNLSLSPTIDKS